MHFIAAITKPLSMFNDFAGFIGRYISVFALAVMVFVILLQVFFRYVLNDALPWPDEAARFCMLWLTGLMAPIALRQGGMVAITSLMDMLPKKSGHILFLLLLFMSLLVLSTLVYLGWSHVNSGWLFSSASLKVPLSLIGLKSIKIKLAWMYMSLFFGFLLMFLVNVELILRSILKIFDEADLVSPITSKIQIRVE